MISVCVPYWERPRALSALISSYAQWASDLPLEFVICDDGSPKFPASGVVPARWPCKGWTEGRVITLPRKTVALNPCIPINTAVRHSGGEIIVLTNPEVVLTGPILHEMLGELEHADYVTARCRRPSTGQWLAGPDVDYTTAGRLPVPPGGHFHFLAMLRRETWNRAGGFDPAYRMGQACDDNDWLWRLADIKARFACTAAVAEHRDELAPRIPWQVPHNAALFWQKWPAARRAAIAA